MPTSRLLGCVVAVIAGGLVACGGDSDSGRRTDNNANEDSGPRDAVDDAGTKANKPRDAGTKPSKPRDAGTSRNNQGTKADAGSDGDKPGDDGDDDEEDAATEPGTEPMHERPQDGRSFMIDEATLKFDSLPNSDAWFGLLGKAGYRVEVPHNWNGILVMYAHGYGGTGNMLGVTTPSIRQYMIDNGYAWAASSYSTNFYDVRAGVEDTNELALEFPKIAEKNGRKLDTPRKYYVIGHSMGGHITGAAIEREARESAVHKVEYSGAVPMCGVMGDTQLFNIFTAFQWAAEKLAGVPYTTGPVADPAALRTQLQAKLFKTYPTELTWEGTKLRDIVRNLSGGDRPNFNEGYASKQWQEALWSTVGGDGTINGILAKPVTDTRDIVYQFDDNAELNEEEMAFNADIHRSTPDPEANAPRSDGLRWIPQVNGEFEIPVVSIHTLGDLYVPFKMQQIYRERADAKGNGNWLVQRAIRGTGHCEFTIAEQEAAFEALVYWEEDGVRPQGDEVRDAATISRSSYGCRFTRNDFTDQERERGLPEARMAVEECYP